MLESWKGQQFAVKDQCSLKICVILTNIEKNTRPSFLIFLTTASLSFSQALFFLYLSHFFLLCCFFSVSLHAFD